MLVGLCYGYAFTAFASVTQHAAPDDMRGRVLAVNLLVLGVMFPVGSLIQGQIADAVGLRWTTAASGLLLAAGLAAMVPWQRRAGALVPTVLT